MNSLYLLVQVSCLTCISAPKDEIFSFPILIDLPERDCWKVYFSREPQRLKSKLLKVKLDPKMFQDETAAFIILYERGVEEVSSSSHTLQNNEMKSIYYWFGSNVSQVLRTETVRHVAILMEKLNPLFPGQIPIHRCVSGLEPKEFQIITNRQYIPVKKLYKVKGQFDIQIVKVPMNLNEITRTDPFVLITSTVVIIFIPRYSEGGKNMTAMQFGIYLSDFIYQNEKTLLYIDFRSDVDQEKQEYFHFFMSEIDTTFKSVTQMNLNYYSYIVDPDPMSTINYEDWFFEIERRKMVKAVSHYYNTPKGRIEYENLQEQTSWKNISEKVEFNTCYITDEKNEDRFIYLGNQCNIKEINHILHFGEMHEEKNWKNLNIAQSSNLPVDFIILFSDCREKFPNGDYVKNKLNLKN